MTRTRFRIFITLCCVTLFCCLVGVGYIIGHRLGDVPHTARVAARSTAAQTALQVSDHRNVVNLRANAKGSCRRANERTVAENSTSGGAYRALSSASRLITELAALAPNRTVGRLELNAAVNILHDAEQIDYLPRINCARSIQHPTTYRYATPISFRAHLSQVGATR